jgi:hypothetical protein
VEIAERELIAALEAALAAAAADDGGGYLTTVELCRVTGWTDQRVRESLHLLADDGRLEMTKKMILDLCGRRLRVPAYRLKAESLTCV